ncbi:MAG: GLPGLI family protein [Bacteroidota bacterium]
MKVWILSLFCLVYIRSSAGAQQIFIPYGKITFEKRLNMQRSASDWNIPDEAKEKMKKYRTSEWELYFDQHKSIYKAKKNETEVDNQLMFLSLIEYHNELFTDYSSKKRIIKKDIMGDEYLLADTIPQVHWKIMQELRIIAGYECRKAIGKINDTITVVAFYTDEILLKGGPEGFSGLPGMILGIAIPRLNTTWFATRVDGFANPSDQIAAPLKGKKTESGKELDKLLEIYSRYSGRQKEKPEDSRRRLFGFLL